MPTPLTTSGRGFSNPEVEAGNPKRRLAAEVEVIRRSDTNWDKFEPIIRRWEEIMGRPAPEPTTQSSEDKRSELNPVFVEWMMSLPEGWVTGHGLTRMEEIKILGNGVVPAQATLALRILLGLEKPIYREPSGQVNLPTPTVSDTFTDNLASTQQKDGSMHSVTLPQAVKWLGSNPVLE